MEDQTVPELMNLSEHMREQEGGGKGVSTRLCFLNTVERDGGDEGDRGRDLAKYRSGREMVRLRLASTSRTGKGRR